MTVLSITELFGTRLPIVAGGLMWLANADYVAAASRAGIMGFITAASCPDLDSLRSEIRRCKELSDGGPFGVNVSMLPKLISGENTLQVFDVIMEEGVRFVETSGRSPELFLPHLKGSGIKVLHKVASVRHAIKATGLGVDAVSIVGAECGGHPGMEMVGTFVNAAWARHHIKIPYLIGGGVGHGSQIVGAMAMGAAGVVIGTRFLVADEIWAHDDYKKRLVDAGPTDTTLSMQSVRNTVRSLRNTTTDTVQAMEAANPKVTIDELMPFVSGKIGRQAYVTGDWSTGILSAGQALAFVQHREPMSQIVATLEEQMNDAFSHISALSSRACIPTVA